MEITGDESCVEERLGLELHTAIGSDIKTVWALASMNYINSALVAVHLMTPSGVVRLK